MAAMEYGFFAALIAGVVVVTLAGMGTDIGTLYDHVKIKLKLAPTRSTPVLPVATPAINNAAGISALTYLMIVSELPGSESR